MGPVPTIPAPPENGPDGYNEEITRLDRQMMNAVTRLLGILRTSHTATVEANAAATVHKAHGNLSDAAKARAVADEWASVRATTIRALRAHHYSTGFLADYTGLTRAAIDKIAKSKK